MERITRLACLAIGSAMVIRRPRPRKPYGSRQAITSRSADHYATGSKAKPLILLFHMADSNRAECADRACPRDARLRRARDRSSARRLALGRPSNRAASRRQAPPTQRAARPRSRHAVDKIFDRAGRPDRLRRLLFGGIGVPARRQVSEGDRRSPGVSRPADLSSGASFIRNAATQVSDPGSRPRRRRPMRLRKGCPARTFSQRSSSCRVPVHGSSLPANHNPAPTRTRRHANIPGDVDRRAPIANPKPTKRERF